METTRQIASEREVNVLRQRASESVDMSGGLSGDLRYRQKMLELIDDMPPLERKRFLYERARQVMWLEHDVRQLLDGER